MNGGPAGRGAGPPGACAQLQGGLEASEPIAPSRNRIARSSRSSSGHRRTRVGSLCTPESARVRTCRARRVAGARGRPAVAPGVRGLAHLLRSPRRRPALRSDLLNRRKSRPMPAINNPRWEQDCEPQAQAASTTEKFITENSSVARHIAV